MKKLIVYLAIPYSSDKKEIRLKRVLISDYFFAKLTKKGYIVFAPISQNAMSAEAYDLPKDAKYWERCDIAFLKVCKKLFVIKCDGWENSKGIKREVEIAGKLKIPVEYLEFDEDNFDLPGKKDKNK